MSFMTTWEGNSYWLSPTGKSAVAYRVLNGIALTWHRGRSASPPSGWTT